MKQPQIGDRCKIPSHLGGGTAPCSDMAAFSLHFTPVIGLSCTICHSLVLPSQLLGHISYKHRLETRHAGWYSMNVLQQAAHHILASHSLSESDTILPCVPLPLTAIIPGLDIELCFKCPGCFLWIKSDRLLEIKHAAHCSLEDIAAAPLRWAANPFKHTLSVNKHATEKKIRWPYPENWAPPGRSPPVDSASNRNRKQRALPSCFIPGHIPKRKFNPTPYDAPWATDIGLRGYIEDLITPSTPGLPALSIEEIVAMMQWPSMRHAQQCSGHAQKIEYFLLIVFYRFCGPYLTQADEYTERQHNDFRAAIVGGLVISTQVICSHTLIRAPAQRHILMGLRRLRDGITRGISSYISSFRSDSAILNHGIGRNTES